MDLACASTHATFMLCITSDSHSPCAQSTYAALLRLRLWKSRNAICHVLTHAGGQTAPQASPTKGAWEYGGKGPHGVIDATKFVHACVHECECVYVCMSARACSRCSCMRIPPVQDAKPQAGEVGEHGGEGPEDELDASGSQA
eukprot:818124-Pelagomonas_calceolata.AAC.4